jgi:CheY-like chemotaxis protein
MMKRVLVVDDDDSSRFVISRTVTNLGCRVTVADDGSAVPELLRDQQFDLLILDLYMPGMNGFEVLRQIRQGDLGPTPVTGAHSSARVLVVSGESYPGSMANARALGADEYLVKPVDVDLLEQTVQRLLRRTSERPPPPHR